MRMISVLLNQRKQQSAGGHVAPLVHIILIQSQPGFTFIPECCLHSEEAEYFIFMVFGLTRPEIEPMIYRTRGEHTNHNTTLRCGFRLYSVGLVQPFSGNQ